MAEERKPRATVTSIRLTEEDKHRLKRLELKGWGKDRTDVIREALRHLDRMAS